MLRTEVQTPYGVVTVEHDETLSESQIIALARKQRMQTEVDTPAGPVTIEHTPAASQEDIMFLAKQKLSQAEKPVAVPKEYEEPEGSVRADLVQAVVKAGEGPIQAMSDFVINPLGKAFGAEEDLIDAEDIRQARTAFTQGLASLVGVKPSEVLNEDMSFTEYTTAAGPVAELASFAGMGHMAFGRLGTVLPKANTLGKSVASGVIADELYYRPEEGNMSKAISDAFEIDKGFLKDTLEYLATDEKDSALTQRVKVGLEGVLIGGGVEGLFKLLGITKNFIVKKNSSISEQADDLLTFIDESGSEIKILPANIHADVQFSPNPNSIAQIEQQNSSKLRQWYQQLFTSRGYWDEHSFNMFRDKEYAQRQTVREAENLATRLNQALDELPVDQFNEQTLTRALTQDFEFSPVASSAAKAEWVAADLNIPVSVAEDIVRTRELIDSMSSRIYNSTVPSAEVKDTIRANIGEYMKRSYRLYEDTGYKPSESVVHNATKFIQKAMLEADETLEAGKAYEQAYLQVQGILNETGNLKELGEYFSKNVKVNANILRRKDLSLPKEIRELLGEIENPTENIVLTLKNMADLAETAEFGAKLLDHGSNKFIFDDKRVFGSGNNKVFYNVKIENTGTALDGKFTTPEIATALAGRQARGGWEDSSAIRFFASAKASSQAMKTVGSWTTHVRNLIGGAQFGLANGINPISNKEVLGTLWNAALKRGDKGLDSLYEEYTGLGVINTSVRLNEFRSLFKEAAELRTFVDKDGVEKVKLLDKSYDGVRQAYTKSGKAGQSVYKGAEAAYQATDDYFKIHAFETELDVLRRANPDADLDSLKKQAAKIVQDTFPNYDKVPNGIKALRYLPIGSFVSFPAEIIRTSFHIIRQGSKEVTSSNPVVRQRGMQRLAGYATTNSLWAGSAKLSALALGLSDEENEAIQQMSHTPWSKAPKIVVRWGDDLATIDTQFIDSYSTIREPIMAAMDRIMNGQLRGEALDKYLLMSGVEAAKTLVTPYVDQAIVTEAFTDIMAAIASDGRTPTGEKLFESDNFESYFNMFPHLFEAFKPGVIKSFENIGVAKDGEIYPGVLTTKKDFGPEIVRNLLGIPVKVLKPEQAIYFAGGNYKEKANKTVRPTIAEDETGDDYLTDIKKRYENLYKYQQDLYLTYSAARTKMEPEQIRPLLEKQIGKEAAASIMNNRFYLPEAPNLREFMRFKDITFKEARELFSEVMNARDAALQTRLIPVEEETQRERNGRDRLARGGEVTNVPQVPVEPDERIDKMTGLPYNQQAGAAFMDVEDPERREQLFIGGLIKAVQKKLKELPHPQQKAAEVLGISKEDLDWANSLGGKYGQREELDGRGDAARHLGLGWLAKQAKYPKAAKFAADAREFFDVHGREMDLANNDLGFKIEAKTRAEAEDKIRELIESNTASFMTPEESYKVRGYAKGGKVDKDSMPCNKPRRTPNHPKKSHVVKACEDGKEKIIRFGEQGAKTAGKPKAGESKRMKAKRKSFKARHRRNIKKGKMSAAYWADKTKW